MAQYLTFKCDTVLEVLETFLVSCVNRNSVRLTNAGQEADMFRNRLKVK